MYTSGTVHTFKMHNLNPIFSELFIWILRQKQMANQMHVAYDWSSRFLQSISAEIELIVTHREWANKNYCQNPAATSTPPYLV